MSGAGNRAISNDSSVWDAAVTAAGGHFLQSWRWGEFKQRHGWSVERIAVDQGGQRAMVQLLFQHRGPVSVAYAPRGPVCEAAHQDALTPLLAEVDAACRSRRSLWLMVEANVELAWHNAGGGFQPGTTHFQPERTVKAPLLDDEPLLQQMHSKTRYSVRLAQRRGVTVERAKTDDSGAAGVFYDLLQDTASRQDFGIHTAEYYRDFMQTFGDDALMVFAMVNGERAAGLIAVRFGSEAIYMYGGSSTVHRAHGAAFLLQFEAMRWAREAGMTTYDLWGIPAVVEVDAERAEEESPAGGDTVGKGLLRFKTGFGGEIVSYPPTLERQYHRLLSRLARRAIGERA